MHILHKAQLESEVQTAARWRRLAG